MTMIPADKTLRLGTRGSVLARAQSQLIANELMQQWAGLRVELRVIQTTGDRIIDRPLTDEGGKGLFTKELEQALLKGEIDFAVHSYKDVPVTMPLVDQSDLIVAAVPKREDPNDCLVTRERGGAIHPNARVGTSSLRRRCQILEKFPDVQIEPMRGNIDSRLRKLREGQFDVIVLAIAGLKRVGLFDLGFMRRADLLPAAGQGALALQCRKSDDQTRRMLAVLNDPETAACVGAERDLVYRLRGDCHSPIAAFAEVEHGEGEAKLRFRAAIGGRGGSLPILRAESVRTINPSQMDFAPLVSEVSQNLLQQGVMRHLHG